MEQSVRTLCS